jgi:hypothetical protein
MPVDRETLFLRLKELGIVTVTVEHAAMFTVAQSEAVRNMLPGAHTKNLFLVDKDGRMALVVAKDDTRVDLKALAMTLGLGRLSFGKPELLEAVLGVPGGSVTPLALDQRHRRGRDGRGRPGLDGFRRGQLPPAREHRDDAARDDRSLALYRGMRA